MPGRAVTAATQNTPDDLPYNPPGQIPTPYGGKFPRATASVFAGQRCGGWPKMPCTPAFSAKAAKDCPQDSERSQ